MAARSRSFSSQSPQIGVDSSGVEGAETCGGSYGGRRCAKGLADRGVDVSGDGVVVRRISSQRPGWRALFVEFP